MKKNKQIKVRSKTNKIKKAVQQPKPKAYFYAPTLVSFDKKSNQRKIIKHIKKNTTLYNSSPEIKKSIDTWLRLDKKQRGKSREEQQKIHKLQLREFKKVTGVKGTKYLRFGGEKVTLNIVEENGLVGFMIESRKRIKNHRFVVTWEGLTNLNELLQPDKLKVVKGITQEFGVAMYFTNFVSDTSTEWGTKIKEMCGVSPSVSNNAFYKWIIKNKEKLK